MPETQPPSYDGTHSNKENFVSLKEYFESRIREVERAAAASNRNSEIAMEKASTATEYRLSTMNEFRAAMADQSSTHVTRAEYQAMRDAMQAEAKSVRIGAQEANENLRNAMQGEIKSLQRTVYTLVGALAALQAIATFFMNRLSWHF